MTFFWILSDFLSGKDESLDITAELMQETEASDLTKKAADRSHKGSVPALWMLLLLRLTTVASDDRLELRNSAIQTLLRIFDAYGDRLSPEAWSICIKSVVFKLLTALEEELKAAQGEGADESDRNDWNGTAVVVLNGISNLLANYIDVLTQHASFNQLWRDLLLHLMTLLDFGVLDINTAAFKSLAHILSQTSHEGGPTFKKETVEPAWELWSRGVPVSTSKANGADNQACLIAYVGALREVYRLIEADLNVDRVRKILKLLRKTVEEASVGSYTSDVEQATQLQAHVLSAIHMLRTNVEGVPSAIIKQISEFIILAFEQGDASPRPNPKRTFVAMSKASMQAVEGLILKHATDKDIYISGAFSSALAALCKPVALKYGFDIVTRSTQPWRLATTTALAILKPALSQLGKLEVPTKTSQRVWTTIVAIADGIVGADCESAPANTPFGDDEAFDISSFRALRELIIPPLGAENVQDKARKSYAESLFKTSIIHAPSPADESIISGTQGGGLSALYTPRAGRTVTVPPTKRTQMAYVVLDELFSLVSMNDYSEKPPTAPLRTRIACTAAPFLILRCALTLRAYIADQPLRGKMPQPLSERKELLWVLRKLVALRCESDAIPALGGAESENRKHLLRLYPLIVKALGVGGDDDVLRLLGDALEVVGGELGL